MENKPIVEVKNLKKHFEKSNFFGLQKIQIKAVDGIDFHINKGETFGLVGESGCGKTTLGRTIIRMYDVTDGEIIFEGQDIAGLKGKELRKVQEKMQIIFQDPYSALNPSMNVAEIIGEPLTIHKSYSPKDREERVKFLLEKVGMGASDMARFPFEFSGGQRQRLGIARALAHNPSFILCDEPISALDVSIQAQVINLLEDFQAEMGLTYLFVAHDLSMVRHISHRIGVMYLGNIVEIAESNELYSHPLHPYTQALISAIPIPDPVKSREINRKIIEGDLPSPINIPSGCRFHTRCPHATTVCSQVSPNPLINQGDGHFVACHLYK